jgi:hypothetical protein
MQKRSMLARMSSTVLDHTKGLGSALLSSMYWRKACSSSRVERCVPRRTHRCVNVANQRSTWFSQEAEVGVKCTWKFAWVYQKQFVPNLMSVERPFRQRVVEHAHAQRHPG